MAVTWTTDRGTRANYTPTVDYLHPPDAAVAKHRMDLVKTDLPRLFDPRPAGPIPDASREVIGALNAMTEQQRLTREGVELRAHEAKNKTVASHYGDSVTTLHRLCHVGRDEDLPPIYGTVAKSTKTTLRSALQRHLDDVADSLGLGGFSPIVTPDLAQ